MAKKTLGRIFPVPEGEYSASKTYKELSIVTYNGNSYICKKQSSGNEPTNTTYWQLMASKGEKGNPGADGSSTTVSATKTYDKYVVVCVAGQSNAVGYDESPIETNFTYKNLDSNRIKQLGFYGSQNLQIIDLGYCAQNMQDMRKKSDGNPIQDKNGVVGTKGIHLPLANLMLDYIPEDYGVLVLPIAFGGTGFTGSATTGTYSSQDKKPTERGQGEGTSIQRWGVGTAYYQTLRDRIIHALTLNEANLFAGIVWCQGENDQNDAAGHKTGFENMTAELFRELNAYDSGSLKKRVPKGEWDKDIWYNMETVYDWFRRNQCQTIWNNYKEWNPKTYVEIKSTNADSNETNGTRVTANNLADHYGNNAYYRIIAPRVLQKMIDMNTFGKKTVVVEQECTGGTDGTGGGSSSNVEYEDERLITNTDIKHQSTSLTFSIDETGKCTASKDLPSTFANDKAHILFGDVYKLDFKIKKNLYWVAIERNPDTGDVLVVGIGKGLTKKLATLSIERAATIDLNVQAQDSSISKIFPAETRVRIYRDTNGTVTFYYKQPTENVWNEWFNIPRRNIYTEQVLGFVPGISGDECKDNFTSDKNILFEDMKIQRTEPFPFARTYDVRFSNLELAASRT